MKKVGRMALPSLLCTETNQHGPHPTTTPRAQIAADCEANGMTTEIKAAGSLRAQIVPNVITVGGCFDIYGGFVCGGGDD